MTDNNELMRLELVVWEDTLERAGIDYEHAERFDDRGAMEFNEELIRWSKIRIAEIEEYFANQKGA
ncbi:hypothetical protein GCM10008014_08480 [Paenibacillus silvae]|uniref:Uncharacterized protein n=1 Tax=Paenibacillus silvae TaxID=1325358 RepID=A0ABQ1Z1R2_9BACL|nr:hypothetical protein [Paenibacillus silvae]GGH46056.1 hypothetical protein GCM10008014_08480 [Paenibacillus silvae]